MNVTTEATFSASDLVAVTFHLPRSRSGSSSVALSRNVGPAGDGRSVGNNRPRSWMACGRRCAVAGPTVQRTGGKSGVRLSFRARMMNCSENPARNWPGGATTPPDPHERRGYTACGGACFRGAGPSSMAQTSARRNTVTRTGRRRRASEDVARETFCSTCSPRVGGNNTGYAATSGPD